MTRKIVQCMGGWCKRRDACAHYHADELPGMQPSERLCGHGADDPERMRSQQAEKFAADPRFAQWVAGR